MICKSKYFIKICSLVFSLIFLLAGCGKGKEDVLSNSITSASDDIVPFTELVTKENKLSDFGRLELPYDLQGTFSLCLEKDYVKNTLGIECLRKNGEYEYSVHKVLFDDGTINYCFISYQSGFVVDSWFVSKIPSKSSFRKIAKDKTTLEQVKQIDKATMFFGDESPSSYHRFSDGTMMIIEYSGIDESSVVTDYYVEQDPVNIVNHLLPADLKLIK